MLARRAMLREIVAFLRGTWLTSSARGAGGQQPAGISVKAFGAIGDGGSHPVSEWIPARYPDFAALKADYPDVCRLTDEIDFAAINKAVRVAASRGQAVHFPAGTYRAWIYVHQGSVSLVGAGSDICRIQLPDDARHRIKGENAKFLEGTPCVIEAGAIGDGNGAVPLRGFQLTGVTLDGNRTRTRAPRSTNEDVFGWGLAFTNFSDARYSDVVAVECHAGGVGTFITSNNHIGEARIERCGAALRHPGFDVNSSQRGHWRVRVQGCPYGVRLIDNCWSCALDARIDGADVAGLVCDNQAVNRSHSNAITAHIRGGCTNAGAQIGDGWTRSLFDLRIEDVAGIGINSIGAESGSGQRGESENRFTVETSGCGAQSAIVGGRHGQWRIDSRNDARGFGPGALFAVDVQGSLNILEVRITDSGRRRLRGLVFRPRAANNQARYAPDHDLLERVNDQGSSNIVQMST